MCVGIGNTQFILGFYINYMECKYALGVSVDELLCDSFILTIWNVNLMFGRHYSGLIPVLY
ncbi:Uncharacterised protein [Clostridioides difficile]|uniref:hypothetical protein n=1 Tax=Clostridioides difficile TaxID=1496 RepID=UPI00097FDD23|nr:Uncharacterised protein [Clostridioides difficile]